MLPYFLLKEGLVWDPGRAPKEIERNIMKAYRRFGSNRYELALLFKLELHTL